MNSSPIKPVPVRTETPAAPSRSAPVAEAPSANAAPADAVTVSVPRSQPREIIKDDPSEAVASLLKGIAQADQVSNVHGRLDPARVMGLLGDD